jgi:hypothetical protein
MFHRMAIPQEADALHVEPVDAQHKEKKRKKEIKINRVGGAICEAARETSNKSTQFTKIKSSTVPQPYPVNNLYPTHYCLHSHTQCTH